MFFSEPYSEMKFTSHYTPLLVYKRMEKALVYHIEITDETHINDHKVKNSYSQDLTIDFKYKEEGGIYHFDCQVVNETFKLAKNLTQQGELLKDLAVITEYLKLTITENGTIKSVNHEDVLKKWDCLKVKLLKTHIGKDTHAFIKGIDTRIKNKSLFLEELKQVKLFGLLFNGYQTLSEHDKPRAHKISNIIKSLSMVFEEKVLTVKDDIEKQERHIAINGTLRELPKDILAKIKTYFKWLKMGSDPIFLSDYKQDIVLNLKTGYLKSVTFNMELINGRGYVRKKNINLRLKNNG